MKSLFFAALMLLCSVPAFAQGQEVGERDALSFSRLSVALGTGYEWVEAGGSVPAPRIKHEWVIGTYAAYNLTSGGKSGAGRTSAIGSIQWPVDTKLLRYQVGIRITIFRGK